ncbi:MAG: biotin/lipoyl-containing protein [Aridibacter sp.]
MKFIAEIDNQEYKININREDSKVFADIEGRKYELETSEPEPNIYLLKHEGKIYEVFVSPNEKADEPLKIKVETEDFDVKIIDPKRLRGTGSGNVIADGIAEIKTAMPGKVVRILLEKDAEVKIGDGIIVVEAMKMQNEMKSPKDGIIKEIYFAEGDTVNAGDVLVVIE